jgi:hypothetical protein
MTRQSMGVLTSPLKDKLEPIRIVEFASTRTPADVGYQEKPIGQRGIGDAIRWRSVEPDRVDPSVAHSSEIISHYGQGRKWLTLFVGLEGPVRDSLDEESLAVYSQELSIDLGGVRIRYREPGDRCCVELSHEDKSSWPSVREWQKDGMPFGSLRAARFDKP